MSFPTFDVNNKRNRFIENMSSNNISINAADNGILYHPEDGVGLSIANETTSGNEFTALHLSNQGGAHSTARTIFQVDLQDINSNTGAGQRKIMFRGRTGFGSAFDAAEKNFMTFDCQNGGVGIGTIGTRTDDYTGANPNAYRSQVPKNTCQIWGDSGLVISGTGETGIRTAVLRLGSPYENDHDAYCSKITSTNNQSSNFASDLRFFTHPGPSATPNATERMCITKSGNVGIGTTNPVTKVQIGPIDYFRRDDSVYGSNDALSITIPTVSSNSVLNDPHDALIIVRTGTAGESWQQQAHFRISRYENATTDARTRLDFALLHASGGTNVQGGKAPDNIMTLLSNGSVGIGSGNPSEALDVSGNIQIQQKYTTSGMYPAGNLTFSTYVGAPRWEVGAIEGYVKANGGSQWNYPGGLAFKTKIADNTTTTAATTKMVIDANGNVGIGTTNPVNAGLAVYTAVTQTTGTGVTHYYFYDEIGDIKTSPAAGESDPATRHISIYANNAIWANGVVMSSSDERIKTNIQDISDNDALNTLRKIQPKIYDYKDKVERGNATTYGFIAQQIRDVLPDATTKTSELIPNIYELVDITTSNNLYNVITFTNFDTNDLDSSSNNVTVLDSDMKRHTVEITEIIDNKTIRVDTDVSEWMGAVDVSNETVIANEVQKYEKVILDASNNVILENYNITSIASMDASDNVVGNKADLSGDNTIDSSNNYVDASGNFIAAVNSDGHYIDASCNYFDTNGNFMDASNNLVGTYKTEWKKVTINGTKIFVYGQTVNDFHTLNKSAIFTVATAALQEVDRQLQAEKAKTATLESQMADLLTRVSALESA